MKIIPKDYEGLWDIFKHIDSIREGRTNFFLVAESMMVAAYMALPSQENILRLAVGILGVLYTIAWFLVNKRQSDRLDFIAKEYLSKTEFFDQVYKAGRGVPGKLIMTSLPIVTLLFWLLLIIKIAI